MDDILSAGDDVSELNNLKAFLDAQFKIKDLGEVHYFLGLEIVKLTQGYLISQHKFALDLLSDFQCSTVTLVVAPLDSHVKLSAEVGDLLPDPSIYRKLAGIKLNYLQHTRLDLSYNVQHLSHYMTAPRVSHLEATYHILRYVAGNLIVGYNCVFWPLIAL